LDNRLLLIKTKPYTIINNKDIYVIPNEGMKCGSTSGNLLIQFDVLLPKKFEDDTLEVLKEILPDINTNEKICKDAMECYLHKYETNIFNDSKNKNNYDDNNDPHSGDEQQSQCVHQ